ncbi:hypothetical protein [Vreelandella zhaodongensis]|uniref:MuF-C-terminal domain-containing protein n=1 Tax=Vreelandella zhaodongensis TaxID=1176240 RepID=UPI003EBEDE6E
MVKLTASQRAYAIKRRKELWVMRHPESAETATNCRGLGGRGKTEFASETAEASGDNVRNVQRHVSRADALGDDLQAITGTSLDKGVELDAQSMPAEERAPLIGERVKIMDRLRQMLVGNSRLFATLNNHADTAAEAGNVINVEQNNVQRDINAKAVALLERATTTPAINQQINEAARKVSEGKPIAEAARELQRALLNGTNTEASEQRRSSAPGSRPADQAGQDAGTGEPVPAVNQPRTAGAGQQRVGGDGQADAARPAEGSPADQQVTLRANGQPFATEKSVKLAKKYRDTPGATPVQVEGGWGFIVQETAQEPTGVPVAEQQPAQSGAREQQSSLTPRQKQASDAFGGAVAGDTITLATDVGYTRAGGTYTIDSIDKDGTVQATNTERGSSVLISRGEWTGASRQTGLPLAQVASRESVSDTESEAEGAESVEARAVNAMRHVIETHQDVHAAVTRPDLGDIDFIWGDEGKPPTASGKRKGVKGIAHILEARQRKDGLSEQEAASVAEKVAQTLVKGDQVYSNANQSVKSVRVSDGKYTAVLSKTDGSNAWLLTGFENWEEGSGEFGKGDGKTESTHAGPTLTRPSEGAEPSSSIDQAESGEQAPDLTLETQTEESLAEREQQVQTAEQAEAEQRRLEAERAQADLDADDFVLSGSDSAADQANARGQDSLFRLSPDAEASSRRDAIAEEISKHPELAGVKVVALPGELPLAVQIKMLQQGINPGQVNGTYHNGDLYVVARNVADTAEGVKTAVHEAVGHKGVRDVLGERLDTEMQRLYRTFPQTHDTWKTVKANYPHIDTRTQEGRKEFAEELAAHLAETNPEVNGWQRFVARVRDMLRQVFPEVAWTENDVRALIQRGRDHLQHKHAEQAQPVITRYSQRGGEDALFTPIKEEVEAYRRRLAAITPVADNQTRRNIHLGRTPPVIARLGADDLPVSIGSDVIYKATRGKHSVSMETIKNLPELLHDPVAVFDSAAQQGAQVVMIHDRDAEGRPVLIPLHLHKRQRHLKVNRIASAYGRQKADAWFSRELEAGRLRYFHNEKGPAWLQMSVPLQLRVEEVTQGANKSILTPDDIGNSDIRFSLKAGSEVKAPRLSAIHNISAEGLVYADQMGGLAAPSIGVVTEDAGGVEGFGEITLIGRKDIADPSREAVFSADAYTVRFPRPEFKGYSSADYRRLSNDLQSYAERFDNEGAISHLREHGMQSPDAGELVSRMMGNPAAMAMYIESQGGTAEPVMRAAKRDSGKAAITKLQEKGWTLDSVSEAYASSISDGDNAALKRLTDDYLDATIEAAVEKTLADNPDAPVDRLRAMRERLFRSARLNGDGILKDDVASSLVNDMQGAQQAENPEVDRMATQSALRDQISDEPAFKRWVEDTFVKPMGEPRIKVGRKQEPYTLDNIVEAMTRSRAIAGREKTMTFGAGQVRAANAEQFNTLEQMREAARDQIASPEEYKAAKEQSEALLDSYREQVSSYTTFENYRGEPDVFEGMDGAMRAAARYLGYKKRGRAAFERALKAEGFNVEAIKQASTESAAAEPDERLVRSINMEIQKWQERLNKLPEGDDRLPTVHQKIESLQAELADAQGGSVNEAVDIVGLGMDAASALEKAPVPYFEAKPQRAVKLNEFAGAVIPEGAADTVRDVLDRNGLPYKETSEENRLQAVHDFRAELDGQGEEVLFSLRESDPGTTAWQRAEAKGLDMSQEGRMQRAREMGYIASIDEAITAELTDEGKIARRPDTGGTDTGRRDQRSDGGSPTIFFHGTADDITAFQAGHRNRNDSGWLGHGSYVTSDPGLASSYANIKAGDGEPNVMPLVIKPQSLLRVNLERQAFSMDSKEPDNEPPERHLTDDELEQRITELSASVGQ